ncbi:transcriptional repressor LexA [Breznakiellaceae bacterium SP9]
MKALTKRQEEILAFISNFIYSHSYPPTIREIATNFSISVKGAHDHVMALKKKEWLKGGERRFRTLELTKHTERPVQDNSIAVPILASSVEGKPLFAVENFAGSIRIDKSLLIETSSYFALIVQDDSMRNAGILNGDTAIIKKSETIEEEDLVNNGEIAAVQTEEGIAVRTIYHEDKRIRLQPENPEYIPAYINSDLLIIGKLAHIIRSY